MLCRFFFCLIVFTAYYNSPLIAEEQKWLGCATSNRFLPLIDLSAQNLRGYEEQLVPYLRARGVNDETVMNALFHEDLFHIAHALSILFEQDSTAILKNFLGDHFVLIEDCNTQIDHVGRELYGPISFYFSLLEQIAPQLGLNKLKHLIFPSMQVVKVLQEQDPNVKGVTIGRIYFQSDDNGNIRCLELFQASLQNGECPQDIAATQERLSLLTSSKNTSVLAPIDHLSIELSTVEDVQRIHNRIQQLSSETLKPYQKEISHNSGDGSTQTKAIMRDSNEAPFNKIVEFVHYEK